MDIRQMIEERAKIFEEMKRINDQKELSQEDNNRWNELNKSYDELTEKITRAERMYQIDSDPDLQQADSDEPVDHTRSDDSYREAFWRVFSRPRGMAVDPDDYRSLKLADDTKGGYLAPDEYERTIIKGLTETNIMRGLATVVSSSSDRKIPMQTSTPTFARIPEEGTYTKTDMSFGLVSLSAYKVGGIILVSEELLFDSVFNLPSYIAQESVSAGGATEEADFVAGDGVNRPRGVFMDAEVGKSAAAADAIAADELMDLYHSLKRVYRQRASWLMHDSTALALRKMKNGDGQYIWQPGLQAGQPDRLLNRPVNISDSVDEIGTGNKPIAFGDYSYYRIMDRVGLSIQRLDELYAESGQVGFKVYWRNDGRLLLNESVKALVNA